MRIQCCQNVPECKMHFNSKGYSFAYRFDGAFICSIRLHILRGQSDIGSQAMGPGNLVESLSRAVDPFKKRRSHQAGRRKSLKDRHSSHLSATNRWRGVQRASQGAPNRARGVS